MPNRCSAPGCRIYYVGEPYTPVFKLPSGLPELVNRLLRSLCREYIGYLLKNVFVCSKHFLDEELQTSYSNCQPDGSYLEVHAKPKLHKEAVQRFLHNCPPLLSSSTDTIHLRFDISLREHQLVDTAIGRSLIPFKKDKELFQITTLQELVSKTKPSDLHNNWLVWSCEDDSFNLIKLFSKKQVEDNTSLKNFLESCSSSCDQDSHVSFSLKIYLSAIQGYSEIELHTQILQSLS